MASDRWFRRSTWNADDRTEFLDRLSRSRNKAQHLRIQAVTLESTGEPLLQDAVIELTTLAIETHASEFEMPILFRTRGRARERLGQYHAALDDYRASTEAQNRSGGFEVDAYLDFCLLVATNGFEAHFPEALALLEANSDRPTLPIEKYKHWTAVALICDRSGDSSAAREAARAALAAASLTDSGLAYHRKTGLVGEPDELVHRQLWRIASN